MDQFSGGNRYRRNICGSCALFNPPPPKSSTTHDGEGCTRRIPRPFVFSSPKCVFSILEEITYRDPFARRGHSYTKESHNPATEREVTPELPIPSASVIYMFNLNVYRFNYRGRAYVGACTGWGAWGGGPRNRYHCESL